MIVTLATLLLAAFSPGPALAASMCITGAVLMFFLFSDSKSAVASVLSAVMATFFIFMAIVFLGATFSAY